MLHYLSPRFFIHHPAAVVIRVALFIRVALSAALSSPRASSALHSLHPAKVALCVDALLRVAFFFIVAGTPRVRRLTPPPSTPLSSTSKIGLLYACHTVAYGGS